MPGPFPRLLANFSAYIYIYIYFFFFSSRFLTLKSKRKPATKHTLIKFVGSVNSNILLFGNMFSFNRLFHYSVWSLCAFVFFGRGFREIFLRFLSCLPTVFGHIVGQFFGNKSLNIYCGVREYGIWHKKKGAHFLEAFKGKLDKIMRNN